MNKNTLLLHHFLFYFMMFIIVILHYWAQGEVIHNCKVTSHIKEELRLNIVELKPCIKVVKGIKHKKDWPKHNQAYITITKQVTMNQHPALEEVASRNNLKAYYSFITYNQSYYAKITQQIDYQGQPTYIKPVIVKAINLVKGFIGSFRVVHITNKLLSTSNSLSDYTSPVMQH